MFVLGRVPKLFCSFLFEVDSWDRTKITRALEEDVGYDTSWKSGGFASFLASHPPALASGGKTIRYNSLPKMNEHDTFI